jgi:hypothetical protein
MFKRKIYNQLLKWKEESKGESALLIEGARRIGKTSIAEEFGKNLFPSFKTIDFSKVSDDVKKAFIDVSDMDRFFEKLFLSLGMSPLPRGSLIILDEIQFCPKARQAIKSLVEDKRYYYLETGSLVSIKENTADILIPSEEETLQMHPMDYEEFLWALGYEFESESIKAHFSSQSAYDGKTHNLLMRNFRTYLAVGGMPKVVDTYLSTHDFYAVDKEKKKIIKLYEEDLRKIDNRFKTITYLVWKQMPSMLSKHSTRFIVSSTDERADSVLFKNTMEKLLESKMAIAVYKCTDPSGGYALTKDEGSFKLYFNDVGLFTSLVYPNTMDDAQDIYQRLVFDKLKTNLGMLFENVSAQILVSNGFEPYYYSWEEDDDGLSKKYEIDFLIYKGGKTIPFEVKSRNVSNKVSLERFREKFKKKIGEKYIVDILNLKHGDNLTYLPYYMLFCVK